MDDNDDDSGLSGWAWHELGRQSERSDQVQRAAIANIRSRLRGEVRVDVDLLIQENDELRQQNLQLIEEKRLLRLQIQQDDADYRKLTEWAKQATAALIKAGVNVGGSKS